MRLFSRAPLIDIRKYAEEIAKNDDAAVAAYVNKQWDWLVQMGENPADYDLVRITDQDINKMKVTYRLEKRED